MDFGLAGKRALVTGASSGLGYAAAAELLNEGVEVTINCSHAGRLSDAADRLESSNGKRPETALGDLSSAEGIAGIISEVGQVDILVSNTGGPPPGNVIEADEAQWRRMADLLLYSAINLSRGFLPGMIERRFGRLIYITSIGAIQPIDDLIFSNTFRAGIAGFCKTVSNNYACHGVTANCVCPGYTATERLSHLAEARAKAAGQSVDEIQARFAEDVPAKRLGRPEELAALIAFLAGERAGYITGCSIPVDGGLNRSLI